VSSASPWRGQYPSICCTIELGSEQAESRLRTEFALHPRGTLAIKNHSTANIGPVDLQLADCIRLHRAWVLVEDHHIGEFAGGE
jgi:hypothetical protein